jgi:hypothetical protein
MLKLTRKFEKETKMRYLSWIVALLLTGAGLCQAAELGQEVRKDLSPLDGRIIAVRADDYLIDQDATTGVRDGDLFAVIQPGQSVRDPKTGKVLGHEETVTAVLRVTQVLRGFSKAVIAGRAGGIRQGDVVRRYALLKTVFWDYTDRGESVYTEMRENLPDLRWSDYGISQRRRPKEPAFSGIEGDLFFILKGSTLEVRDAQGRMIKAYSGMQPRPMPVAVSRTPAPMAKSEMIGVLPMAACIADFISDGNQSLLAATDDKYVRVYAIDAEATLQASWSPDTGDRIVALCWWRPDPKGPFYLGATLWTDQGPKVPRGVILRWRDNTLRPVATVLSSVLGAFDRDGDGVPETLLRQEFDPENFFGRRVKTLRWSGDKILAESLDEKLPNGFTVTGSILADLDGDGNTETAMIKNGFLFIYRGRKQLYKSPRKIGGSTDKLTFNATPGMQDFRLVTVRFEVSPLWCDVDGDDRKELVVPAAEGINYTMPGLPAEVDRSWLAVIRHEQGHFATRELSENFERPIQGLGLSSHGVLFLTTHSAGGQTGHGQAMVYRFPIHPTP